MARTPLYTSISFDGPFFRHDPARTFRSNARSMMRQVALQGETDIKGQLAAGESGRAVISNDVQPARVRAHVTAGVPYTPGSGKAAKAGNIIVNVYVPNFGFTPKQGRALMAAYGGLERRTHAFRRTTQRLRKVRGTNLDELLRGIA